MLLEDILVLSTLPKLSCSLLSNQIIVEASNYTGYRWNLKLNSRRYICSQRFVVEYVFLNLVYWYFCIKGVWMFSRWPLGGDDLTSMLQVLSGLWNYMLAVIVMDIHYCFVETTAIKHDNSCLCWTLLSDILLRSCHNMEMFPFGV